MSYFNHKWKSFLNESKKDTNKKLLTEKEGTPGFASQERTAKGIPFPKLRISEEWGKPRSGDRSAIRTFSRKIQGSTFRDKIGSINAFVNDCKTACIDKRSTGEMISNLVLLDALAAIIYDYNAASGGFLFEGFVAQLLGGQSRQVPAGAGGIEDIIDNKGEKVSLKFFKEGGSSYVGGSYGDLRESIEEGKPMKYLVVLKDTGSQTVTDIKFYEFTVGSNGKAFRVKSKKPTAYRDPETGEIDPDYVKTGYEYEKEEPIPGDFIAEDYVKAFKGKKGVPVVGSAPAFEIPVSQVVKKVKPYSLKFGGPKFMKNLATTYIELIGNDIAVIYEDLDSLSNNLTNYFVNDDMNAGNQASQVAANMPRKISKIMSQKGVVKIREP